MSHIFRRGIFPGAVAAVLGFGWVSPVVAQFFPEDQNTEFQDEVIIIGDSPEQWDYYLDYWQQLKLQGEFTEPLSPDSSNADFVEPTGTPVKELAKNLVVRNLKLNFIIKLSASSQLSGTLTNRNKESVTVEGVNFEVLDTKGNLIQTGSAVPKPNVLAPGQSVTFQETLLTVPPDAKYKVKLSEPAFIISVVNESKPVASK